MDDRILIGNKIDLEKIETELPEASDKKPQIYVSQVLDEAEDGNCLAAMPIHEGKVVPLNINEEFLATFYTKNGLLRCKLVITERLKKGSLFLMKIVPLTEPEKVQRREYFRLECNLPLEYRVLDEKEKSMLDEGIEYDADTIALEWEKAHMLDLSGGGIRFVSSHKENKDSYIQVRFQIEEGERPLIVYAYAVILRSEQNQNNRMLYSNRVMFLKMPKSIREKIVRFIFNVQRKRRLKESGLG